MQGLFTIIEPGITGRNSDGGIFKACSMNYWIIHEGYNIPLPSPLWYDVENTKFPRWTFPLSLNLLKPYSSRTLDNVKILFNYRLSRGRKSIDFVFGMAAEKCTELNRPIRCCDLKTVNNIIKSDCILHNFVWKRKEIEYTHQKTTKNELDRGSTNQH